MIGDEKLYRKRGRRYESAGNEFVGWPSTGVWLVQETPNCKGSHLIMKVGDLIDPSPLAALHRHEAAVAAALRKHCKDYTVKHPGMGPSYSELVSAVYMFTCKEEEKRVAGIKVEAPTSGTVPFKGTVTNWMEERKKEVLAENQGKLDAKAEFDYYLSRDDHEAGIAWEDLTEERRNQFREAVRNRKT